MQPRELPVSGMPARIKASDNKKGTLSKERIPFCASPRKGDFLFHFFIVDIGHISVVFIVLSLVVRPSLLAGLLFASLL